MSNANEPIVGVPTQIVGDQRGWHIDKSISISTLVACCVLGSSILVWGSNVNQRLAVHDNELEAIRLTAKVTADENTRIRSESRSDLQEIARKLDRLIERTARLAP